VATIEQVFALADASNPAIGRCCSWRPSADSESASPVRSGSGTLTCSTAPSRLSSHQQLADGTLVLGPPKTDADLREVAIPGVIVPDLEEHLRNWCTPGRDNLVFPGVTGRPFRQATLHAAWHRALKATGIGDLRFHDLRHKGKHARCGNRRQREGADGAREGRADLPARDQGSRRRDCRRPQRLIEQTREHVRS
jgi:hypothetical protein